jgi:hypothetical protein
MRARRTSVWHRAAGAAVAAVLASALLSACQPEPASTPTGSSSSPSASPTQTTSVSPSASPSASPSPTAEAGFELPAACEEIYSAKMLASLEATNPPLNDPGVTMDSSQNTDALELLASGIPTIRCSWGRPSEYGLATNVSIVDAAQSAALVTALRNQGFACDAVWHGTRCVTQQTTIDQDDNEVTFGESHFLRGTGWVSTAWVEFAPVGYTQDIATTLWG